MTSTGDARIPFVIAADQAEVELASWAAAHRAAIDAWLLEHRALLFRGFALRDAPAFHAAVCASSAGPLLEYRDRSTPRYEVGQRVYVSTVYPPNERIHLHNEGTYWTTWPLKIYFCCLQPAATGGETPIADMRRVAARIDPQVQEEFRRKQVMYVRNYNPGIGLSWQDAFQAEDPREVEAYGAHHGIAMVWHGDGRLRTRQTRPAFRAHPRTAESIWFNHAAFFHVSSLKPRVREALLSAYGEEDLPYNTYFGDATPIPADMVAHIRDAYAAEQVAFPWQAGDVLMLDNMTMAHARESYTGDRTVIVAMTEAHSDAH